MTIRPLTRLHAPLWDAGTFQPQDYLTTLSSTEAEELLAALGHLAGRDPVLDRDITASDFPLPELAAALARLAGQVAFGTGFGVIRGLPVAGLDEGDCALLLRGVAAHLGQIATQSRDGQLLRHVRDAGGRLGDGKVRGHSTSERLWFHTDGADAAVLLCRRTARHGGISRLASAATVHNAMLEADPELAAELYKPFHFHMAGGNTAGCPPTFVSPVFSVHEGRFSCRYVRHTLLETPKVTGIPHTRRQLAAFDELERAAEQACLGMTLEVGDLQVVNNHVVLHSRTAYEADVDPSWQRHLLRAWVTLPQMRGRRPGLIEDGLRRGWLTDDLQRRAAAQRRSSTLAGKATDQ